MAKKLGFSADLPWSVEALFALASSEECIRAKGAFLEHEELTLSDLRNDPDRDGGVVVKYKVETHMPGVGGGRFTTRNSVTETVTWSGPSADGHREYRFVVAIATVPVEIEGVVTMTPLAEDRTRNAAEIRVASSLPLLGGKIEDLLAGQLKQNFEGEVAFVTEWMTAHVG